MQWHPGLLWLAVLSPNLIADDNLVNNYDRPFHFATFSLSKKVALAHWEAALAELMYKTVVLSEEITAFIYARPSYVRRFTSGRSHCNSSVISKIISATMATQVSKPAFDKLDLENPSNNRTVYRPFLLDEQIRASDWISELELDTAEEMARQDLLATAQPLRILVLYGSLRKRYDSITKYQ